MNLAIRVTCKKQVWQWAHKRCESNGLWEIWAVYYKHLGEKWPCYNKTRMHYISRSCNIFLSDGTWYRIQHSSNNTDRTLIMFHTADIHKNIHCEWRAMGAVVIKSPQYTGGDFMFLYRFVRRRRCRRPQILVHVITFEQLFGFLSFLAWLLALTYRLTD